MKLLLTLLMFIMPAYAVSSESTVEALLAEIVSTHKPTPENEARLMALFEHADKGVSLSAKIRIAELYWKTGRFEQAENILAELSKFFPTYSPKYQVESLLTWASFELRRNNYIEAEGYARQANDVAQKSHQALLANTLYILGNSLQYQRKLIQAKQAYENALQVYIEKEDGKGTLLVLNSLGVMFKDAGDLANGTKYLLQAREAVERYGSASYRASVYFNLGDVFLTSNEPDKAIEYYQKALLIDQKLGDLGNIASDYRGIASGYIALNQYPQALGPNQKAIEQLLKIKAPQELSRAYLQQSRIYTALGDNEKRLSSLLLAEKSAEKSASPYQRMSVGTDIAKYELDSGRYEQAQIKLHQAMKIATELSLDKNLLEITKLLSGAYRGQSKYQQADAYLRQSVELMEQLNTDDRREKSERYKRDVNLLEEQLKVSELEKSETQQKKALEAQNAEKQLLIITLFSGTIVFAVLTFLLVQRRKLAMLRADLFEQALQEKKELFADVSHELRTPLAALKIQIQALQHDIVSDVEDSYDMLDRKVNEINNLISDIYQLAQADAHSLEFSQSDEKLAPLFDAWRDEWQTVVEGKGFNWQCKLALADARKSLDVDRVKQVIDNLLSNSMSYTDIPGTISLSAHMQDDKLVVSVEDTVPTVSEDKLRKIFTRLYRVESSRSRQTGGSGLGLAICESLINAHGGSIKAEQSILGGLKVTFII